ncbi:MAG: hypothetical protein P8J59_04725, partial [Phycisphaerales bacterium]|nr:hypothetical protein [Phycisphaerales bacterium]
MSDQLTVMFRGISGITTAGRRIAMATQESTVKQRRSDIVLGLFEAYYERVYAFARKSAEPA